MTIRDSGEFDEYTLAEAIAFVRKVERAEGSLIACPVARLQVRFRLGFQRAYSLAERLQQLGIWEIRVTARGLRGALVLPPGAAG